MASPVVVASVVVVADLAPVPPGYSLGSPPCSELQKTKSRLDSLTVDFYGQMEKVNSNFL